MLNTNAKAFKMNSNKRVLEGSRKDILEVLKKAANPNCSKCFGRGYIGWKEDKNTGSRVYVVCQKCVENKVHIT